MYFNGNNLEKTVELKAIILTSYGISNETITVEKYIKSRVTLYSDPVYTGPEPYSTVAHLGLLSIYLNIQ